VHAAIAAQIGNWDDAEHFWRMGLQLDLLNLMRNTALGIHPGNMASTWQALMFHILGLRNSPGNSPVKEHFLGRYGPIELQSEGRTITIEQNEVHTAKEEGPWASMAR
jgi:trehalose/maltose hydrolase-like predicted phosphorylase